MVMAYTMTPARKAALRKAQQASARKRRRGGGKKSSRRRKNIRRAVVAGGVAVAVGGTIYANKKTIKKKKDSVRRKARQKLENNHKARTVAVGILRDKAATRKPRKGLKMDKRYRMGRPDVRRRRKAKR